MTPPRDQATASIFAADHPNEWGPLVEQNQLFNRAALPPDIVACSLCSPVYGKATIDSQLLSRRPSPHPATASRIPLRFSPPYANAARATAPNPPKEIS